MIAISIDINPVVQQLSISDDEVASLSRMVLDKVGDAYRQEWEKLVGSELHSTKDIYFRSMDSKYEDDLNLSFILNGKGDSKLAMMIEEGASAFDIKEGMKRSSKATHKGSHWYLTVPMRQGNPEAVVESSTFSGNMPQRVYEIAKENAGSPVSFDQLPAKNQQLGNRPAIVSGDTVIPRYDHKTPIYEGLVKSTKPQHSGYCTFRRISDKSDDNSWIHKGFSAHKFMEKALQNIKNQLDDIVESAKFDFLDAKFGK